MKELVHILFYKFFEILNSRYYFLVDRFYGNKLTDDVKNKVAMNYVSATHSYSSIIFCFLYFYYPNRYLLYFNKFYSIHYFMYDSQNILVKKYNKLKFLDYFYLFHHYTAILILYNIQNSDLHSQFTYMSFFWSEVSNVPYYLIYHLLKTNGSKERIDKLKKIQKYHYSFIRVFIGGYYAYNFYITGDGKLDLFLGILLYLSGLFFSYMMFKN